MLSEIVTGLAAANQATQLLKELRDIDRSVDEAGFKLKLAELTGALADTKVALSEANLNLNEKELAIRNLTEKLEAAEKGDICPKCREGRMLLLETKPQHMMGMNHYGVELWTYNCGNTSCGFAQTITHDPHGVVAKTAQGKR